MLFAAAAPSTDAIRAAKLPQIGNPTSRNVVLVHLTSTSSWHSGIDVCPSTLLPSSCRHRQYLPASLAPLYGYEDRDIFFMLWSKTSFTSPREDMSGEMAPLSAGAG